MFIKQVMFTKLYTKQKFTNTLCLQNKQKTKVYVQVMFIKPVMYRKHVMFTKQNKCLQHKCLQNKKFTNTLCLQNKIQNRKFTKQNKCLQTRCVY